MDWKQYPNFKESEFSCKHTGKNGMAASFMQRLQKLRTEYGKPMVISSGYRDKTHPVEEKKAKAGAHSTGHACDIRVYGGRVNELLALAIKHGFTGIGINQKGNHSSRFIHLDDLPDMSGQPRPWVWSY